MATHLRGEIAVSGSVIGEDTAQGSLGTLHRAQPQGTCLMCCHRPLCISRFARIARQPNRTSTCASLIYCEDMSTPADSDAGQTQSVQRAMCVSCLLVSLQLYTLQPSCSAVHDRGTRDTTPSLHATIAARCLLSCVYTDPGHAHMMWNVHSAAQPSGRLHSKQISHARVSRGSARARETMHAHDR